MIELYNIYWNKDTNNKAVLVYQIKIFKWNFYFKIYTTKEKAIQKIKILQDKHSLK
jgi:hypothetical protein